MKQDPTSENVMKSLNALTSPHPDIESLIAYAEQQLDEETYDAVQEHLLTCETCTEALLSFHEFRTSDLSDVAVSMSEEDISASFKELKTKLEPNQARPFWKHYQIGYALAACFAIVAITASLRPDSNPPLRITQEQPKPVLELRNNQRPEVAVYQQGDLFPLDASQFMNTATRIVLTDQRNTTLFELPIAHSLLVDTHNLNPGKYTIQLLNQDMRITTFYFEVRGK